MHAGSTVFAKITFAEIEGSFERTAIVIRGHVYHFHVMWPDKVLCDHLQGQLLLGLSGGQFVDMGCGSRDGIGGLGNLKWEGYKEAKGWACPNFLWSCATKRGPQDSDQGYQANRGWEWGAIHQDKVGFGLKAKFVK